MTPLVMDKVDGGVYEETVLGKRRSSSSPIDDRHAKYRNRKTILEFRVQSPAEYTKQAAVGIQQPLQIMSFSYDDLRKLHHDDRSQRFYHDPPAKADLNRGFENFVERDEKNEHLDSLLYSLMKLEQRGGPDSSRVNAKVITWRGMMTKLCTVLYDTQQGFEMNAMMLGDTLYIEEHVGKEKQQDRQRQQNDARLKRFGYYGYSFESYCCHQARNLAPDDDVWDGDVNTNVQWCSVVKTKIGDLRIVIGGEVDAVDPQTRAPIEVKTSMQIRSLRDEERFEKKMLRFYMQSFLLGVQKVVVGFRNARGILVTHQSFATLNMPRAVRGKPHGRDPSACLNLAGELLSVIRKYISQNMPFQPSRPPSSLQEAEQSSHYPVYRIQFKKPEDGAPQSTIRVFEVPPDQIWEEIKEGRDEGRVGFLPSSYYTFSRERLPRDD